MSNYTDRLQSLLTYFPVQAHVFHSGFVCRTSDFDAPELGGQIHLVQSGRMQVLYPRQSPVLIEAPGLLFFPRPVSRQFVPDKDQGVSLVCAGIRFGGGGANPLTDALPSAINIQLNDIDGASGLLNLLFSEAFSENCGRQPLTDRLFESVVILLLRHLMVTGEVKSGMMAGLAHPQLRRAITAMHDQPSENWSLNSLADLTAMSRSVFANTFREIVGTTPGYYLQSWRINLVQQSLLQGQKLKMIPEKVGYGSEASLLRAFKSHCGMPPGAWLKHHSKQSQ